MVSTRGASQVLSSRNQRRAEDDRMRLAQQQQMQNAMMQLAQVQMAQNEKQQELGMNAAKAGSYQGDDPHLTAISESVTTDKQYGKDRESAALGLYKGEDESLSEMSQLVRTEHKLQTFLKMKEMRQKDALNDAKMQESMADLAFKRAQREKTAKETGLLGQPKPQTPAETEETRARARAYRAGAAADENELRGQQGGGSPMERLMRKVPLVGNTMGDVAYGQLPAQKTTRDEVTATTKYTRESIERLSGLERDARTAEAQQKYGRELDKVALSIRESLANDDRTYSNDPNREDPLTGRGGNRGVALSVYELKLLAERIDDPNAILELAARAPNVDQALKALVELAEAGHSGATKAVMELK